MRKLLTMISFVLVFAGSLNAQDTVVNKIDTSYFKVSDDSWNLVESVIKNDAGNVQLLLQRGADANAVSSTGNSALIYASEMGNIEIMNMLVDHGADVDASGFKQETPLFMAIFSNDFQATKSLLENGANPNIKDEMGVTPLMYAAATNQYQSADLLLFYEADESVTDKDGNDPLLTSVTFQNIETSDVLLQNGLNPNTQDSQGNTPAIVATQHGSNDILELLLEYKADVNIVNNKNYSPLAYAVTFNDYKTSKLLIEHNADVNHQISQGRNIIELARIANNDSLIALLEAEDAELIKRPDFSSFHFSWGNSFSTKDYFIQFRGSLVDSKYGYFIQTGVDYRPILLKVQIDNSDTIYQFRERRLGWSHGVGKYIRLYDSPKGLNFSLYGSLNGYLSFPKYLGTSESPNLQYDIIPAIGASISGNNVGIKLGTEWYKFGTMLETGFKFNVTLFVRLVQAEKNYDRKEINW